MRYATLMAHLELGRPNTQVLRVAADLALRSEARVIGIAACQPMKVVYGDGYVSAGFDEADQLEMDKEMAQAEAAFRAALQANARSLEWRATRLLSQLSGYVACQARSADLVITGRRSGDMFDAARWTDTGDLVMQAGRPVLVVPEHPASADRVFDLRRMVIGWKDSRETRRAVAAALPMLQQATDVTVVEIVAPCETAASHATLEDVTGWLRHHHVTAERLVVPTEGDDASALAAAVESLEADVLVAGAYGHSRLRERVLGGVTRHVLSTFDGCALLSH